MAAVRWWAALTLLGLAALPLVYTLLRRLFDRGYAFRAPGRAVAGGSRFLAGRLAGLCRQRRRRHRPGDWHRGRPSGWFYRRRLDTDPSLREWRENMTAAAAAELLFLAIFALWVWVRAKIHPSAPPRSRWSSPSLNGRRPQPRLPASRPVAVGFCHQLLLLRHVMVSLLGRLSFVAEPQAFNLAIAWIVAGRRRGHSASFIT